MEEKEKLILEESEKLSKKKGTVVAVLEKEEEKTSQNDHIFIAGSYRIRSIYFCGVLQVAG